MWELAKAMMKLTRGQEIGLNKALICGLGDFGIVEWKI
jgi:hypothetical protein